MGTAHETAYGDWPRTNYLRVGAGVTPGGRYQARLRADSLLQQFYHPPLHPGRELPMGLELPPAYAPLYNVLGDAHTNEIPIGVLYGRT